MAKAFVAAGVLCSVVLVLDLGLAGATFSGTTDNASNSVSALVVEPPTAFDGTVSLNVLPLATCRADLTWTPSVTPGDGLRAASRDGRDGCRRRRAVLVLAGNHRLLVRGSIS